MADFVTYYNISKYTELPPDFVISVKDFRATNPVIFEDSHSKTVYEIYLRSAFGTHVYPATVCWGVLKPAFILREITVAREIDEKPIDYAAKQKEHSKRKGWNIVCLLAKVHSVSDAYDGADTVKRLEQYIADNRANFDRLIALEREMHVKEKEQSFSHTNRIIGIYQKRIDEILRKLFDLGFAIEDIMTEKILSLISEDQKVVRQITGLKPDENPFGSSSESTGKE